LTPWATEAATTTAPTPHVTIYRDTSARSAGWAFASLFPSLDHDTHMLALPNVNANTAFATLRKGEGGNNRTARSVETGELEECTRFGPYDVKILDRSETTGQGIPQGYLGNVLLYAL
jgi:hypothetical protein